MSAAQLGSAPSTQPFLLPTPPALRFRESGEKRATATIFYPADPDLSSPSGSEVNRIANPDVILHQATIKSGRLPVSNVSFYGWGGGGLLVSRGQKRGRRKGRGVWGVSPGPPARGGGRKERGNLSVNGSAGIC